MAVIFETGLAYRHQVNASSILKTKNNGMVIVLVICK